MSLREYHEKRKFQRTPEPQGKKTRSKSGRLYVIQKHHASRLHYDLRLELDGTLKSWAVPKGPSLDPLEKRLAVQVEDHPIEYGDFEGIIPEGEYGGGAVIVWDHGAWQADDDAQRDYQAGRLKFHLQGSKLRGGWMLVRMPRRAGERTDNWLLIKERDEEARPTSEFDVVEDEPDSVKSGRSIEEVAAAPDRVWSTSGRTKKEEPNPVKARVKAAVKKKAARAAASKTARSSPAPKPRAKKKG